MSTKKIPFFAASLTDPVIKTNKCADPDLICMKLILYGKISDLFCRGVYISNVKSSQVKSVKSSRVESSRVESSRVESSIEGVLKVYPENVLRNPWDIATLM